MRGKDPEKRIENLEESILLREGLIEDIKGRAGLADLYRSIAGSMVVPVSCLVKDAELIAADAGSAAHHPSVPKLAERIRRNAAVVSGLLDNLVAGRWVAPPPSPLIDLNAVVAGWVECFMSEPSHQRGIRITLALKPDLPHIAARECEAHQIVHSLATNAVEAMTGATSGILSIRTRGSNDRVTLEVCDTGCGIPRGAAERIFKPYFTTKHGGGSAGHAGLGLFTAARIAEALGGSIAFESEPGMQTVFRVTLPVRESAAARAVARGAAGKA